MVSNVQLTGIRANADVAMELDTRSRFLVYQNRVEHEAYFFVGKRSDTLRLEEGFWRLLRRIGHGSSAERPKRSSHRRRA